MTFGIQSFGIQSFGTESFHRGPKSVVPDAAPAHNAATTPRNISPLQWQQAIGLSRQSCARVFREGGTPTDALTAFGISASAASDWPHVVELIAEQLCAPPLRRAA